jgi:hypothetical protein
MLMRRFIWCALWLSCAKPAAEAPPRAQPVTPDTPLHLAKPDEAKVQLDLAAARSAIAQKQQIEGATPPDLSSLGVKLYFPADLNYDPTTGRVSSRTYPQY